MMKKLCPKITWQEFTEFSEEHYMPKSDGF